MDPNLHISMVPVGMMMPYDFNPYHQGPSYDAAVPMGMPGTPGYPTQYGLNGYAQTGLQQVSSSPAPKHPSLPISRFPADVSFFSRRQPAWISAANISSIPHDAPPCHSDFQSIRCNPKHHPPSSRYACSLYSNSDTSTPCQLYALPWSALRSAQ